MSYDFNCPHCGYGMNKDQVDIHEDDVIGEWDTNCLNCKKTFVLTAEPSIDYWTNIKVKESLNESKPQ